MEPGSESQQKVNLKQTIGLGTGVALIVGGILGSGIFVSPQGVVIGVGSYGLSFIVWILCALLSLCGALTYAELGSLIPKSGSAYYYLYEVFGQGAAFVYMFTMVLFILPSGVAITALTCAEYFTTLAFADGCGSAPDHIKKTMAVLIIMTVMLVNVWSVRYSGKMAEFFTVGNILALIIIIGGGIYMISKGHTEYLEQPLEGSVYSMAGIAEAINSAMWAFAGWEGLNYLTEEIKQPHKNLPRAIFISIPLVTVISLLTNLSYFSVLSPKEMMKSAAVAMTWAKHVIPSLAWFIPLAVSISSFGSTVGAILLNPRLVFVAAREQHMPSVLSMVNVNLLTPAPAIVFLSVLSVAYIFMGTVIDLIHFTGVVVWMFHFMVALALFILRRRWRDIKRPYKVPIICPIVLLVSSLLLFICPIIGNPKLGYFFAVSVVIAGFLVYLILIRYGLIKLKLGSLTVFLQLLCHLTNPETTEKEPSTTEINPSTNSEEDTPTIDGDDDIAVHTISETVDKPSRNNSVTNRKFSRKATKVLKKLHSICLVCRSDMCVCSVSSAGSQVTAL